MPSSVDHSELTRYVAELGEAPAGMRFAAPGVALDSALGATDAARALVDVHTGELRDSIGFTMDGDGLGYSAGPTARHGGYHEFGTSDTAAEPYMLPAFDAQVDDTADDLGDHAVRLLR